MKLFQDVPQRRNEWVETLALKRGVPQPTHWGEYTTEQWRERLRQTAFSTEDMNAAVQAWKHEFEETDFQETDKVKS